MLDLLKQSLPEHQKVTREEVVEIHDLQSTVLVARNDNRAYWDEALKPETGLRKWRHTPSSSKPNGTIEIAETQPKNTLERYAFTVHDMQGQETQEKIFIDPLRMWHPEHIYVAVTRAKRLDQIYLVSEPLPLPVNPQYQKTKIYQVISPNSDQVYIGYTTWSSIEDYFYECHIGDFEAQRKKQRTSKYIILKGDAKIELIEEWPCNSQAEALARETYWIEKHPNAVNKVIPHHFRQVSNM